MDDHLQRHGPGARAELLAREKAYSQPLSRAGRWPHLRHLVEKCARVSVLDCTSNDEPRDLPAGLPPYPTSPGPETARLLTGGASRARPGLAPLGR